MVDAVLPDILEKTYAKGWSAEVRIGPMSPDPKRELARLDTYLWSYKKAGFLPHGRADEPGASEHPILLSFGDDEISGRDVVCLLSGAQIPQMSGVERCITLFADSHDEEKALARQRWKDAQSMGATTAYWAQNEFGKWIQPLKKA